MALTALQVKNASPGEKVVKFKDGGGLYLEVRPSGKKVWRMRYWIKRRENTLTFGEYPLVSLKDARTKRDEAKRRLADKVDPGHTREVGKVPPAPTFGDLARSWLAKKKTENSSDKYNYVLAMRLGRYILPHIGNILPDEITAPQLLEMAKRIEASGAVETAHRVVGMCGQIFRFGIAAGAATKDLTASIRDALQTPRHTHFASMNDTKKFGALLRDIDHYSGSHVVRSALIVQSLVFVRPGELRFAEWSEIDFDAAEWRIPPEKMKMRRLHVVPLSSQALARFAALRERTGGGAFVFPSIRARAAGAPMSAAAMIAALRAMGYARGEMTIHGFRHTASTLLNESGLWSADAIERQLSHVEGDKVRATYNYAEYLTERRRMMQWWADYLDELRKCEAG